MVDDDELLELVELEVRELLSSYDFPGMTSRLYLVPFGAGRQRLLTQNAQGENEWVDKIYDLMDAVDSYIPTLSGMWISPS